MKLHVTIRQLGKRKNRISAVPWELPQQPSTLRELLAVLARSGAEDYNRRLLEGEGCISPMTEESLQAAELVGKLAFGVVYSGRTANPEEAARTAVLAYEDGLFRVFRNQEELTELDAPLSLNEGDELVLIRLTMLTGSIW